MRIERKLAMISMLLAFARAGASQDEPRFQPSFAVTLTAQHVQFKAGAPVPVKLSMTNTSDHDLRFDVMVIQCKPLNYVPVTVRQVQVELYDSKGTPVPLTLYGKAVRGQVGECAGKGQPAILKPGENRIEEADLGKEFDVKNPGTYTVRALRFDKQGKAVAKSDAITVKFAEIQ